MPLLSFDEQTTELLRQCVTLASAGHETLLHDFVRILSDITGCELAQVYLLDSTGVRLHLDAEHHVAASVADDAVVHGTAQPALDYRDCPLLHFTLRQGEPLYLNPIIAVLHDISFLPECSWRTLLCVPLADVAGQVKGLMLCASSRQRPLHGAAGVLAQLGTLMLARKADHAALEPSGVAGPTHSPVAPADGYGLIGDSLAISQTRQMIGKVLRSDCTVLLNGETGTGKEVVARAIHHYGERRAGAFVVQNCAACPEGLLESELFGYRKGAFTGALRDRPGLFDTACGGTLLLDEIGDMPLSLQAKLLRVLQEGEIRPLGCNQPHRIDVRVIAATHRDLRALVKAGAFREDLYYRLAQFPIELPALRHRQGDVATLARHFAALAVAKRQGTVRWSEAALDYLNGYGFPGNVRELKGLVERAVLLSEGRQLRLEHFIGPPGVLPASGSGDLRQRLERVERALVIESLHNNGGNRTQTARELGMARRTLLYRLQRLNIRCELPADC
ncbi:sigma 54-interacting transcriptional regulator [Pseudomonas sp. LJDD11]|uniref:sigma-54 interaction domain-containing protein n=1 Tax=Pseudomonas sp. LJDD11 TaxID=2931984 RepID=UPI00211C5BFD|nr:sigma 54-interacting transcriptional regulator [Pseudomonas sp. LJDD11]MCQ9422390.1 sigma 54-interacting transcriptional regulator [Pseudomonas sp. LJDD11]